MELFQYQRVQDPAAATQALASDASARFLAGGTTLIDLMKLYVEKPSKLVDINELPFNKIEEGDSFIRIGANVRNSDLAYNPTVKSQLPALSEALLSGASAQLRNMATTAGNLLQRTRCYYFRDPHWACNKRQPGSGCSAIEGYNRIHAVLGTSEKCIATHPSDMCVAMVALQATVLTRKADGSTRRIPIEQLFVSYGDDPARENTLDHGELITAVEVPLNKRSTRSHYLKVRDRASYEFALASAAVALEMDGKNIASARVALGGVATMPWRSAAAEKALVGKPATDVTFQSAANAAMETAKPQAHNAFKIELARRTIVRALETVAAMA